MKIFNSEQEASKWMYDEALMDEEFMENYRFAFKDDIQAMEKYEQSKKANDFCDLGTFDEEIMVGGRLATIGCDLG